LRGKLVMYSTASRSVTSASKDKTPASRFGFMAKFFLNLIAFAFVVLVASFQL
jgi:hypothetical protein